ncbi:MAG TPA: hypothetical protein VEY70_14210 [Metabacillus sp.]|nr:hypothetical protein [Metabacillus sp.]
MEWIMENKEWVFSGIGVFILSTIVTLMVRKSSNNQKQKVGNNSTGIQVGRDLKIGEKDGKK